MRRYLKEKLQKENIYNIVQKCKAALNKGHLTDSKWEKNQIEKIRKYKNLERFCYERKIAQLNYDKFCRLLEKKLPIIEKIRDSKKRLSKLLPFFEEALRIDGVRRSFDYTFNLPGNILDYYISQLEDFLQKNFSSQKNKTQIKEWIAKLVNINPYKSYSFLELRNMLTLLSLFPKLAKIKDRTRFFKYLTMATRKGSIYAKKIRECCQKHARGDLNSLAKKLVLYIYQYAGQEKILLRQLINKKDAINRNKLKTIKEIEKFLSQNEKIIFRTLVDKITHLIYINEYEDPFRNNNMDGLADYFLRKNIANALHQLNKIKSLEPMDYPQRYLLRKTQTILKK